MLDCAVTRIARVLSGSALLLSCPPLEYAAITRLLGWPTAHYLVLPQELHLLVFWSMQADAMFSWHDAVMLCHGPQWSRLIRCADSADGVRNCGAQAFLQAEKLGESETWYCGRCKAHVQAQKKLDMWRLPELMVVLIKRFEHTRGGRVKLDAPVSFPLQGLDLAPYLARAQACPALSAGVLRLGDGFFLGAAHA